MSSYKRPFHFPPQPQQPQEKPWLKYPDSEKSSNVHSRTINAPSGKSQELTLTRSHSQNHGHNHHVSHRSDSHHKASSTSSKLLSSNSSNASLPLSMAGSNSSSDSLAHHSYQQQQQQQQQQQPKSNRPRTLEDEIIATFQNNYHNNNDSVTNNNNIDTTIATKPTTYPSPVTPSDLLNINPSAFSNNSSSNSSSTTLTPSGSPLQRSESTSRKQKPSPLSINTTLADNIDTFEGSSIFPQGSPISVRGSTNSDTLGSPRVNLNSTSGHQTPRLSHSSHSSTASNSSYSNPSSPSSVTSPPCSALCHSKSHNHSNSHQHHHHHHSKSHNKHDRPHRHHHSCSHHSSGHHHSSNHRHRSDRASKTSSRYGFSQLDEQNEDSLILEEDENQSNSPEDMASALDVTPPSTTTAVTIVGSTPAFGIGAFREGEDQQNTALGLYSTEPPKKRQRSAAAALFGAAFETVIFTSAVALSAYQLLTGKGRPVDSEMEPAQEDASTMNNGEDFVLNTEKPVVQFKTAPVNIPTRSHRHRDSSMLGKSLHHNHHASRSHHHKHSHRSRNGLSSSLPHADAYDHMKANLGLPDRPNTGTEDSDEQFLRMEAQLTTLIAEGKRALSTRVSDWR